MDALSEYYKMRPEINQTQKDLVSSLYLARRGIKHDERVTVKDIDTSALCYEPDMAQYIIQRADDHYLDLVRQRESKGRGNR